MTRRRRSLGLVRTSKETSWWPWLLGGGAVAAVLAYFSKDTISNAVVEVATSADDTRMGNNGPITVRYVGNGQVMRSDAADAFNAMVAAAEKDGITIFASSAYRDFQEQSDAYAAYLARGKTAPTVAKPGTSNHTAGIAVDIGGSVTHPGTYCPTCISYADPEYSWMMINGVNFGFDWDEGRQVNEPWHWNFLG